MAVRRDFPTLADRTKALLVNTAIFYSVFCIASGRWLPTGGLESVWLLSAFSLWLLSLLSAPWFVPPRDALANGIAALCILVTIEFADVATFRAELNIIRWIFVGYCLATILMALIALFLHDRDQNSPIGHLFFKLTGIFGRAELFYTPPALVSILGAYQSSYPTIAWLLMLWMIFVIARPIERFIAARRQWQDETDTNKSSLAVGLADLNPIFPAPSEQATNDLAAKLFDAETGAYGAGPEKKRLDEALKTMRTGTAKQIDDFLLSEENNLAVFELAEIANTKATLRLTELYLSAIMNWARQHRKARQVLIVLEEAHTIIPEVFGSGFDYDTQWVVGRIGQIALQGRKYGVGLMVVSQRTALVSKTILSQCNTFLTHSLIDQTSLNFLQSVYSEQHTRSIPNLGFLEFLAFGKAVRAERPILLKRPFDQSKQDASDKLRQPLVGDAVDSASIATPVTSPVETLLSGLSEELGDETIDRDKD